MNLYFDCSSVSKPMPHRLGYDVQANSLSGDIPFFCNVKTTYIYITEQPSFL